MILITGASRGLGRALALACARHGASVIASGRDVPALERLADTIEQEGLAAPALLPLDLQGAGGDDYATVAGLIEEQYSRLDALVLNAAMLGEISPLDHLDGVTWAKVFQVNLHSSFLLLRACLPALAAAPAPMVLFTLANSRLAAKPNWGAYAVSQAGARALMQLSAAEARDGRPLVCGIEPPPMATTLRAMAYPAENRGGLAAPEDVALVYLDILTGRREVAPGAVVAVDAT